MIEVCYNIKKNEMIAWEWLCIASNMPVSKLANEKFLILGLNQAEYGCIYSVH